MKSSTNISWIGPKVDYYNTDLDQENCTFYKSCKINDETYNVGDFSLVNETTDSDPKLDKVVRLLCFYESHHKKNKFRAVVRWYEWARNLSNTENPCNIEVDKKNEVIEDHRNSKVLLLQYVKRKCNVIFGTKEDPVYLIRENNLNNSTYFSCRYRITNKIIEPIFSDCASFSKTNSYYDGDDFNNKETTSPNRKRKLVEGEYQNHFTPEVKSFTEISPQKSKMLFKTSLTPAKSRSKVVCNLNKSFEDFSSSRNNSSMLNYSIVDQIIDENKSIKMKLRKSEKTAVVVLTPLSPDIPRSPTKLTTQQFKNLNLSEYNNVEVTNKFVTEENNLHTKQKNTALEKSKIKSENIKEDTSSDEESDSHKEVLFYRVSPIRTTSQSTPIQNNKKKQNTKGTSQKKSSKKVPSDSSMNEASPNSKDSSSETEGREQYKHTIKIPSDFYSSSDEEVTENKRKTPKVLPNTSKNLRCSSRVKRKNYEELDSSAFDSPSPRKSKKENISRGNLDQKGKKDQLAKTPNVRRSSRMQKANHTPSAYYHNLSIVGNHRTRCNSNNSTLLNQSKALRGVSREGSASPVSTPKKFPKHVISKHSPNSSLSNELEKLDLKNSRKSILRGVTDNSTPKKTVSYAELPKIKSSKQTPLSSTPKRSRTKSIVDNTLTPSMHLRTEILKSTNKDSLFIARSQLHVSYVPENLPCREKEYSDIFNFLQGKLLDGMAGCMYISGVPGTGKTATVTEVIRNLQKLSDNGDLPSFSYININGMKLSEPRQSYVEMLKQLDGISVRWEQAQAILEGKFTKGSKKLKPVVLVVDELDILCTKRQDVVYNLLDWPTKSRAQLIVITIANTMDLPERLLMGRVTSRLGLTRLTFQPYNFKQLQEIIMKRLIGTNVFNPDAIQLVARKVASVSGDARRALDICRRAAEIAEQQGPDTLVDMKHVSDALNTMITQPKIQAIRHCSRLEKLILQSVAAEVERTGVEETNFDSIYKMFKSLAVIENFPLVSISTALASVSRLTYSRLLLIDQKYNNIYNRIILNVSSDDIYYALNKFDM